MCINCPQNAFGGTRRTTVEECVQLDTARLTGEGAFDQGGSPSGGLIWRGGWGQRLLASVGYRVDQQQQAIYLEHVFYWDERPSRYPVKLETTELPWGGKRWWFQCPFERAGCVCSRRVAKLYLPPATDTFGCRSCHNLTYQSKRDYNRYKLLRDAALLDGDTANLMAIAEEHRWFDDFQKKERRNEQRRRRRKAKGWK